MISEEETVTIASAGFGDAQWMSPELLFPERFNLKEGCPTVASDCYALGMVIYEILSGKTPFYQHPNHTVVLKILAGERPLRPQGPVRRRFTDGIWEVLEHCWKHQPADRMRPNAVLWYLEGGTQTR